MELVIVQECRSNEGWQPVRVPSSREDHPDHTVLAATWLEPNEYICDCESFQFRGYCHHQEEANEKVCLWSEFDADEPQTEEQKFHKICPRCGGPTRRVMEYV